MRAKAVSFLLADLNVTKTHSRPYTSNDNPYSKSQFKTMKYRPEFPDRFGCLQDGRTFCQKFSLWYNGVHRHSGIGLMTPQMVHYGRRKRFAICASRCSTRLTSLTLNASSIAPPKPSNCQLKPKNSDENTR